MDTAFKKYRNLHRTHKPVQGGHMEAVHFGDFTKPIKLIYLHANGFTGLSYHSILEPISSQENVHIIALNLRGHGATGLPIDDEDRASHTNHARDLTKYIRAHIDGSVIVAGHSLGANTAILAAGMLPQKISKVLAFDPVVLPLRARLIMASRMGRNYMMKNFGIAKNAGRRRDKFVSHQEVYKRYHGRGPFKQFPEDVLKDYIHDAFIAYNHQGEEGVHLACRPRWEQLGYVSQPQFMKRCIGALPSGSRVLITDFIKQSKAWMARAQRNNPGLRIDFYPDKEHFFPLTEPDISMAALREILQS